MKKLNMFICILCLTMAMTIPANAMEYTVNAPNGPEYGKATSIEPVYTADRGEAPNLDMGKNTALIPPIFGSPTSYLPGSGEPLTPNMAGNIETAFNSGVISRLPDNGQPIFLIGPLANTTELPAVVTGYTAVTSDLYYTKGYLGTLKIPSLSVNVKVYEGTNSSVLAKGAGHFEDTSIWDGNVAIAGHNRGVNCYFGDIHTLTPGDKITLTTKLGTRTYEVTCVTKISETDHSLLAATAENCITLITCVKGQSSYRWAVRAIEK